MRVRGAPASALLGDREYELAAHVAALEHAVRLGRLRQWVGALDVHAQVARVDEPRNHAEGRARRCDPEPRGPHSGRGGLLLRPPRAA